MHVDYPNRTNTTESTLQLIIHSRYKVTDFEFQFELCMKSCNINRAGLGSSQGRMLIDNTKMRGIKNIYSHVANCQLSTDFPNAMNHPQF